MKAQKFTYPQTVNIHGTQPLCGFVCVWGMWVIVKKFLVQCLLLILFQITQVRCLLASQHLPWKGGCGQRRCPTRWHTFLEYFKSRPFTVISERVECWVAGSWRHVIQYSLNDHNQCIMTHQSHLCVLWLCPCNHFSPSYPGKPGWWLISLWPSKLTSIFSQELEKTYGLKERAMH
jgi:hypothetical protein